MRRLISQIEGILVVAMVRDASTSACGSVTRKILNRNWIAAAY